MSEHLPPMPEPHRSMVLELADYLGGPLASFVDLEVAMMLRAIASGDYSEVEERERRLTAIRDEEDA